MAVKGFSYEDVSNVINFLYTGAISLESKKALRFRQVAVSFGVRGMENLYHSSDPHKGKVQFFYMPSCSVQIRKI